eukprot:CAMPEP_0183296114 /NCGR_PEP_ID=MMETSP0160_2-20130417/3812_1 /TAXON_ID=2839 ORGANISM="Odontella Sinensis, Strain Grunow 1884" /NCGR_SAMPLE_ID=MMETSP0160_2 /ASSEMBLY_ACC=CAM_ASM_000250 /LENGTH=159 /DNA_ID=CAMNT_0025457693 /DNA_START=121 /DNA_END=600 /DNA_ORIENTATION=+
MAAMNMDDTSNDIDHDILKLNMELKRVHLDPNEVDSEEQLLRRRLITQRLHAFVHIRILLKMTEREDRDLYTKANRAVRFVSQKHRSGSHEFRSLATSICKVLRHIVGEKRWREAGERRKILLRSSSKKALSQKRDSSKPEPELPKSAEGQDTVMTKSV